jgi:predicted esterase
MLAPGPRPIPVMHRNFARNRWIHCVAALLGVLAALAVLAFPRAAAAKTGAAVGEPLRIEVEGASDAYYFKPRAKGPRPILMYLHGRGGNPAEDCRKWAKVGTQFGWVVCPSGSGANETGGRTWSNGAVDAQKTIDATIQALRTKYKGRVQRRGNVLIGFSEGAFVAMQVGLKDQTTWTRWLILGASDAYWGGDVTEALDEQKRKVRRVYLLTGENDGVAQNTVRVGDTLKKNNVPVKVRLVPGMGHEVPSDRMVSTYRRPLAWLIAAK